MNQYLGYLLLFSSAVFRGTSGFSRIVFPRAERKHVVSRASEGDEGEPLFAFGVNLASRYADVKRLFDEAETKEIIKGMEAFLLDEVDAQALLREKASAINEMLSARAMKSVNEEKERGAAFLAEAAKEDDASQTESGIVIKHIKEGAGPSPTSGSTVKVHYTGTLIDGSVFDSSRERGEPATFALAQVIKGWQEALLLMQQGGTAKITIPSDLAYGDNGSSDRIPGGATLIFEVELLEVLTGGVGGLVIP